jgi:hypothetical protein
MLHVLQEKKKKKKKKDRLLNLANQL